jgi:hypothetical protein
MSVYTPVTTEELDAWLARYNVGRLTEYAPIAAGIENTNYFVTTEFGRFVLTLYERMPATELPFYLNLMAHLAHAGVPVPAPEPDRTGALFSLLNGKPAGLVARVSGEATERPAPAQRAAAGAALATLHVASARYRARLTNRRGPAWWRQAARAVKPYLKPEQNELLAAEIRFQTGYGKEKLPKGAIHGDLFRASSTSASRQPISTRTTWPLRSTTGAAMRMATWCPSGRMRSWPRMPACVLPLQRNARSGRRCCAPRRCVSGCPGSTTCTCPVQASSRIRTIRRSSNASCARARMRCRAFPTLAP